MSDIMYEQCFEQLDEEDKVRLKPIDAPVTSFGHEVMHPCGVISFPVTLGDGIHSRTEDVEFLVLHASGSESTNMHGYRNYTCQQPLFTTECSKQSKVPKLVKHIEPEKWALNSKFPEQTVTIGPTISEIVRIFLKQLLTRLKNAGATYQRSMDNAFKDQMGCDFEVYMDDLVIKSMEEYHMLQDIEETFQSLRKINLKLNPNKCSYDMEEGKFLSVIVTSEDIAIGAVLLTDRKTVQTPIYYVSRTLVDAETRYSMLEKLVLELRRLVLGLRLVNPEGHEFTYTIKLDFKSTNNEAEYEAFLAGLRIANKLGVRHLEACVDSILVARKINGSYEAKNEIMASYLSQAKELIFQFASCKVIHIKRSENKPADALSKMAATSFEHLAKDICIEVLKQPSVPQHQVLVIQTGVESWMTPLTTNMSLGMLTEETLAAQKIRHKALNFQLQDGILYRRSFLGSLLRCVDIEDANYLIREVNEGICGLHAGPWMVVANLMNAGCYWPGMHVDAVREIRKCDPCQRHAPNTFRPKNVLVPESSTWPFHNWAIGIMGSFQKLQGMLNS
ncbi:uncharacterized protein LOC143530937 [Bidens hawaiensis]|uniref:uncharacterized protein LOC143530937 n=1 Tax=Bidens hawaiensis TaxID=980011 RepID=UPI0040490432